MNREYVYVTEYAGNTLAAVDFENQTIATRYPAGQNPIMAVEGDSVLYVGNSSGGKLQAFNIDTGLNTPIAAGQQPLGLVIDEDSQILYACDYFSSAIQIIDTKLGSMTSSIPLSDVGFMGRTDPSRMLPNHARRRAPSRMHGKNQATEYSTARITERMTLHASICPQAKRLSHSMA